MQKETMNIKKTNELVNVSKIFYIILAKIRHKNLGEQPPVRTTKVQ